MDSAKKSSRFDFKVFLNRRGYKFQGLENGVNLFQKKCFNGKYNAVCIFDADEVFNASSCRNGEVVFFKNELPKDKTKAKKILRKIE